MLHGYMLHVLMLHGHKLCGQILHGQMLHRQMLHGQMLHDQLVLGHLSTVKDGSKNLKCPSRYFLWGVWVGGVGGENLKLMLIQSICAETWTELGNKLTFAKLSHSSS